MKQSCKTSVKMVFEVCFSVFSFGAPVIYKMHNSIALELIMLMLTLSLMTVPSPKLINFPKLQTGQN